MANTFKFGNGEWAVGKETVLAYNDENNNFKPLPFTFDRGSTATVVNKDGLIETVGVDEPRIDFLNNSKGHLLLEPQRQNVITYSEEFDNAYWLKVGGAVTANYAISPDGTQNADRFFLATAASNTRIYINYTFSAASYTMSVYAKKNGTTTSFRFSYADDGGQSFSPDFQLTDEWQRFTYSFTSVGGSGALWIANTSSSGVGSELDIILFGAQLEVGSYATSYIPTSGSAVTRSAESCNQIPPDGVIGQTEGTFFIEIGEKTTPSISLFEFGQGSAQHRFFVYTNASNKLKVLVVNNYSLQVDYTSTVNVESNAKIAIGYANDNYAIYLNGSLLATDTNATVPPMNQVAIGADRGAIVTASNQIKETKLYNTRLSNSELATLTTI